MRHQKRCKSLDNIGERARVYRNFFEKPSPLLLLGWVAGEGRCQPIGSFGRDFRLSTRKGRGDGPREPLILDSCVLAKIQMS
jgi:hypothetical protein